MRDGGTRGGTTIAEGAKAAPLLVIVSEVCSVDSVSGCPDTGSADRRSSDSFETAVWAGEIARHGNAANTTASDRLVSGLPARPQGPRRLVTYRRRWR
jgi:hypothetical protein